MYAYSKHRVYVPLLAWPISLNIYQQIQQKIPKKWRQKSSSIHTFVSNHNRKTVASCGWGVKALIWQVIE